VPGEQDARPIAAIGRRVVARPAYRARGVSQEIGVAGLGKEPVTGHDGDEALGGERLADEAVIVLGPGFPGPAMKEDEHWGAGGSRDRHEDVEPLPRMRAVGDPVPGNPPARIAGRERVEGRQRRAAGEERSAEKDQEEPAEADKVRHAARRGPDMKTAGQARP
jgi:hypothetical protein